MMVLVLFKNRSEQRLPRRGRRRFGGLLAGLALAVVAPHGPAAAATGLEVAGRVVDETGAPVARARVELQPILPRYEIGSRLAAGHLGVDPEAVVESADDGRFSLSVPAPGMWQIEVRAAGKIPLRNRLTPLAADRELEDAVVTDDGGVWVTVSDAEGEPIGGAWVWMRPHESEQERRRRRPSPWTPRGRMARTDEGGTAYLSRRRDRPVEIWAFAQGFLPSDGVTVAGDHGRIELERGRPLRMRFVTAAGEPAQQAIVGVGELQWVSGRTDHRGEAVLYLRPDDPLPVTLHLPTGQRQTGTLSATLEELAPRAEPEIMTLPPPLFLTGRVVEAGTHRPAAGARVWSAADPGRLVATGPVGGYELLVPPAGYWQVGAFAPGYLPAQERRGYGENGAGPTLSLRRVVAIAGRVVDPRGSGVTGAEIGAQPAEAGGGPGEGRRVATSGANGRFRLDGLEAATPYRLEVRAAGFAPARRVARSGPDLEIVLEPGLAVLGRVVTTDGDPLPGARLLVMPSPESWMPTRRGMIPEPRTADSAADGSFRLDDLPREQLILVAQKRGFAPTRVPLLDLPPATGVGPAAPVDLGDVIVEPSAVVAGRVENRDEEPVGGVRVDVVGRLTSPTPWMGGPPYARAEEPVKTDAEGRFVVADLARGEVVSLAFEHGDYLRASVDNLVAGDDELVEVILERVARVSGRVEDEAGAPVPEAVVQARPIGGRGGELTSAFADATRRDSAATDRDGRFALERVAPGSVELEASSSAYVGAGAVELTIAPGERREGVVLRVRRGRTLEGTVRNVEKLPVAGAILQVERAETARARAGGPVSSAQSDSNGRFLLEGLDPDVPRITVGAFHPEYLEQRREVDLGAGRARVDIELERGLQVSGVVLGPSGEPIAGASVGLDRGSGVYFGGSGTGLSAEDGGFTLEGVGPGTYRLFAMKEGFARSSSREPVTVVDRAVTGLTLRLSRGGTIRGRLYGLEPQELGGVQLSASDGAAQSAGGFVGSAGEFTIPQVGFARGTVRAWLQGTGRFAREEFELDPEGGEAWVELDFERVSGASLSGTVLLDGEPWRNLQVVAQGALDRAGAGRTDARGRFEIRGLEDGRYQILLFGGSLLSHSEPVDVIGDTEVTIEVSRVAVRGRVIAADTREPVPRAVVSAVGLAPAGMEHLPGSVETTAGGGFELMLPANRRVTLRALAAGSSEANVDIDTGPGPFLEGVEIELGAAAELEVEVRLESGFPPAWVSYLAVDGSGGRIAGEVLYDAPVPLRLRSIPPGDWTLIVAADGGAQVAVPVRVPGSRVVVVLPPPGVIEVDLQALAERVGTATVRVFDAAGSPVVFNAFGNRAAELPLYSSVSEIPSLPPGEWVVEIRDDRGQVWRRAVTTTAGETTRVSFE